MSLAPGQTVKVAQTSRSKYAGKMGTVKSRVWGGSHVAASYNVMIFGTTKCVKIAESQLQKLTDEQYNAERSRNSIISEEVELFYVMSGDVNSVDGPFTHDKAKDVAASIKHENEDMRVVILRAIAEAKQPRIVVDFDKL